MSIGSELNNGYALKVVSINQSTITVTLVFFSFDGIPKDKIGHFRCGDILGTYEQN